MKTRTTIYLEQETTKIIKRESKKLGLSHSQFIEKIILIGQELPLPEKKIHDLSFNHLELLKFIYTTYRLRITIRSLERFSEAPQALFSKRSVRDGIFNLFSQEYIERDIRYLDKRVKHYKLTKKSTILMDKLGIKKD